MATALLMHPNINVSYFDSDVLNTLPTIAAQNIVAFNSNNVPQNLNLGGTSNINMQAFKNINIEHGATSELVVSTADSAGNSNSYLSVAFTDRVVLSDVTQSGMTLTSTDTIIGTTHLAEQANFLKISSTLDYGIAIQPNLVVQSNLGVSGDVYLQSNVYVQGNETIFGNLTTQGKFLAHELAIYKSAPVTTDATQVGYSWVIDDEDRLELVKYTYFNDLSVVTKKIATFGYNQINLGADSDITYETTKYANTFNIPTPIMSMLPQAPQILQAFASLDNYGGTNVYDLSTYFSSATSFTLGSPATNLDLTTSYFYYGPGGSPSPVTLLNPTTLEVNVVEYDYNFVLATLSGNILTVNWSGIGIIYKIDVIATNSTGTSTSQLIVNDIFNS